jgi:hypothetical protein
MNRQDIITIAEFGGFTIEAVYDYRIELSYENKHAPVPVDDVKVEKVELHIKRHQSILNKQSHIRVNSVKTVRTIRLLDIPPWLWELLNDQTVIEELDRDYPVPDPDEQREDLRYKLADLQNTDDKRDY